MNSPIRAVVTVALLFGLAGLYAEAGPSLPVTKPPVIDATILSGPPGDPPAVLGQWFTDRGGVESVRSHEFYDELTGGIFGPGAIQGHVATIQYDPMMNIVSFSIDSTISNDSSMDDVLWQPGNNSHGEQLQLMFGQQYAGVLFNVKLVAEFAVTDTNNVPLQWLPPYRDRPPYIVADNEDQSAWYCWNPQGQQAPHGNYFVPAWDFGDIAQGGSATRRLDFSVPAGLPPSDLRYAVIQRSFSNQLDVLMNRSLSLKISTWIDELAIDTGLQYPEEALRSSDVSVFHNIEEEEESLDFGDAPDPSYPTLLAGDGARHAIVPGVFMGNLIDAEPDGQPTVPADGDDLNNLDDEDGVTFATQLVSGKPARVDVSCSTNGFLSAWIDYDQNGSWAEAQDTVFATTAVTQGMNHLPFTVPAGAALGMTYARFRFTTIQTPISYTGLVVNGEVEDYQVSIQEEIEQDLDFGDAPDPSYPTLLASDGARHVIVPGIFMGLLIDAEPDGQPTVLADGDDVNPAIADDEDGVTFFGPFIAGQSTNVLVQCSVAGILAVWVDFNTNGSWGDFGENVAGGIGVTQGMNYVTINVPAGASIGATYARFRFTTLPVSMTYSGLVANGEVEDYRVMIERLPEEELDFGDAMDSGGIGFSYPTLLINNGARHLIVPGIHLGAQIDAELNGQPTINADGDDLSNLDDEDGVFLPPVLYAGSIVTVRVVASVSGHLNAWIDWNSNWNWIDPGEHVFNNQPLAPGINLLPLNVPYPPALVAGGPHSRWRFTTMPVTVPSFTGLESDGEVEDYEVHLEALDFGDAPAPYPTLLVQDGARHRAPSGYWLGPIAPDIEPDGQPTANADGDDLNPPAGLDDEDGVLLVGATALVQGSNFTFSVQASTNGYLNAWLDWNRDGDWADPGEQIAAARPLVMGPNPVAGTVPLSATPGKTYARFRFGGSMVMGYTGLANNGEVEDYTFTIYQPGPSSDIIITNLLRSGANAIIRWRPESAVTYETQATTYRLNDTNIVWQPFGPWVVGPANEQTDLNATDTMKFYRVVAPFAPPP